MPVIFLLSSAEIQKTVGRYNEYAFQCGAIYGIMMKLYQEKGDKENSEIYKFKFDILADKAEKEFQKIGRSKTDADTYIQNYASDIALRAVKDTKVIPDFINICRRVFPDV
jgi:hypothetical protein